MNAIRVDMLPLIESASGENQRLTVMMIRLKRTKIQHDLGARRCRDNALLFNYYGRLLEPLVVLVHECPLPYLRFHHSLINASDPPVSVDG